MNKISKLSLLLLVVLLATACTRNIVRNDDGSLAVETKISQQELQQVITSSIADPLVKNVTVSVYCSPKSGVS